MRPVCLFAAVSAALLPPAAAAEVTSTAVNGFTSRNQVEVPVAPGVAWRAMLQPGLWWSGDHTYSGDARNMTIAAVPGGCFCETIPAAKPGGAAGAIEHMRVLYVAPDETLRMSGGLGPLQPEAVSGVLTMTLEPKGSATRITWELNVGGYFRTPPAELAPLVDSVIGEQLRRLADHLGKSGRAPG